MKFARAVRRNTARRLMQEVNAGRRRGGYKMPFSRAYKRVCAMKWKIGQRFGRPAHGGPLTVQLQRAQRRIDFMGSEART